MKRGGAEAQSLNEITEAVIGAAIEVHRVLGPGLLIELKSVESLQPVHAAQVLTYLRLLDKRVGLLINFRAARLVDGIKRVVNSLKPPRLCASASGNPHV